MRLICANGPIARPFTVDLTRDIAVKFAQELLDGARTARNEVLIIDFCGGRELTLKALSRVSEADLRGVNDVG